MSQRRPLRATQWIALGCIVAAFALAWLLVSSRVESATPRAAAAPWEPSAAEAVTACRYVIQRDGPDDTSYTWGTGQADAKGANDWEVVILYAAKRPAGERQAKVGNCLLRAFPDTHEWRPIFRP